jgi:hypothetical protein
MITETVELTAEEAAWLEDSLPLFSRLGFRLEPFGSYTFVVRAVPAVVLRQEPLELLLELVAAGCKGVGSGWPEVGEGRDCGTLAAARWTGSLFNVPTRPSTLVEAHHG